MNIIDCHAHLDVYNEELPDVLSRAQSVQVSHLINIGTEKSDWLDHFELAQRYRNIDYTVGIHPLNINNDFEEEIEYLYTFFSKDKKPVAIGEIGLDYHLLPSDSTRDDVIKLQHTVLEEQLKLAKNIGCPIVIHCREAFDDCKMILEKSGVDWNKIAVHCFSCTADDILWLNSRGARGSFTGDITFAKNDKQRAALRAQGIEKLMIETDCPYLTPVPNRGKRNEPMYLRDIAKFAAKLLSISEEELSQITYRNTNEFFALNV